MERYDLADLVVGCGVVLLAIYATAMSHYFTVPGPNPGARKATGTPAPASGGFIWPGAVVPRQRKRYVSIASGWPTLVESNHG